MSHTVDEAKLRKVVNEMLRQRCTLGDKHQYHIDKMQNFLKNDIVWESKKEIIVTPHPQRSTLIVQGCQRDPKALTLSLVNQDLLYLKKGSSGPKKIVRSLQKFHAVIFLDDDIEERTSRWLGMESYQQKVNLTTPTITFPGIQKFKVFSIVFEPIYDTIYKNNKKEKRAMRHQEVRKFCDAMLKRVLEGLKSYNNDVKHGQHKRHANEVRIMRERYPYPLALVAISPTLYNPSQLPQHSVSNQPLTSPSKTQQSQAKFPQLDSSLAVPMFQQGEDPIKFINKEMAFLSVVASRVMPVLEIEELALLQREILQLVNQELGSVITVKEKGICQDSVLSQKGQAVLMANLSSRDPEVLSEVKEKQEKDKIKTKPDKNEKRGKARQCERKIRKGQNQIKTEQKREACRSREKFKAVTVGKGRKSEQNAKRMAKNANAIKSYSSLKE
nr:hypothetical protein [Tanacetum cinerariifolium]